VLMPRARAKAARRPHRLIRRRRKRYRQRR